MHYTFNLWKVFNSTLVQIDSASVNVSVSFDEILFAVDKQSVEQEERHFLGPRAAGALHHFSLVDQLGTAVKKLRALTESGIRLD